MHYNERWTHTLLRFISPKVTNWHALFLSCISCTFLFFALYFCFRYLSHILHILSDTGYFLSYAISCSKNNSLFYTIHISMSEGEIFYTLKYNIYICFSTIYHANVIIVMCWSKQYNSKTLNTGIKIRKIYY